MHYLKRIVLVLLFLLLIVSAIPVAFMALNIPIDLHLLKRPLIHAASTQLGLDVSIDGDMRLVPGLEPTLEMGGVLITDPRGPEDSNRIGLGFARVQLALVPLVFGEIRIEELTAEDIEQYARNTEGLEPRSAAELQAEQAANEDAGPDDDEPARPAEDAE